MNYAENLANRLVSEEIVSKSMTEKQLIAIIIKEAKKEVSPSLIRCWLTRDNDFLSDAVSTVNELLRLRCCARCTRKESDKHPMLEVASIGACYCEVCHPLIIGMLTAK